MRNFDENLMDYFSWLLGNLDIVPGSDGLYEDYYEVLLEMFSIEFRYVIDKDFNRVSDALMLRKRFENGLRREVEWHNNCSVLEILIGLSRRLSEDVLGDENDENLKKHWFWTWFYNLGLMNFGGRNFDKIEVGSRIAIWINRDFEYDGLGSPFPLVDPPCDQRECEIWKQVMLYLAETGE